eukprot:TRINITY_DN498_c1_g1_i1.p1 TRINITY_DN498_c1_g1~~TRINITY_DN498_c1_g1_i1.p1  ORF type:complete len:296 (+),score=30.92 TRINITY_DN498_c1_g1_i1:54-941(+)
MNCTTSTNNDGDNVQIEGDNVNVDAGGALFQMGEIFLQKWFDILTYNLTSVSDMILRDLKTLKQLSLTSKSISTFVRRFIQNNFSFTQFGENITRISYYTPKRIINVFDIAPLKNRNITHISLRYCFNHAVDNLLPTSLTHLVLGNKFNDKVDRLPPKLTHLTFGVNFNFPTNNLPQTLLFLKYGFYFNQIIKALPPDLQYLEFGYQYNSYILCPFPPKLTYLKCGWFYNLPIRFPLPSTLTQLHFGYDFNCELPDLPSSLTHLSFLGDYNKLNKQLLPPKLNVENGKYFVWMNI